MVALSILDLSPVTTATPPAAALNNTLDLARFADRLGFTRYWLAEHHNLPTIASSAPDIMIGQVAAATRNMRIGSSRLTIRFERAADGSVHHDVLERDGRILVLPSPPPASAEPETLAESVKRWAIDHAPGRLMWALRIALGAE